MQRSLLVAAIAASLALAACETKQDTGTLVGAVAGGVLGNQFGKGAGRVAATMAGAVVGGIVGNEIGRWRNPNNGRYGEIVADDYYERGGARCRNFVHKVWIDGRPQAMRGTACRNPDGTWTQVG